MGLLNKVQRASKIYEIADWDSPHDFLLLMIKEEVNRAILYLFETRMTSGVLCNSDTYSLIVEFSKIE